MVNYWFSRFEKDINAQKLSRKRRDPETGNFQITGLCEGLGEYFQVNPWVLRAGFVAGAFLTNFWMLFAYLGLVLFIPSDAKRIEGGFFEEEETAYFNICENCSTAVKEGSLFCHKCGTKLT